MKRLKTSPHCPTCNKLLTGYTAMEEGTEPHPGDVTVCDRCEAFLEFTDKLGLKLLDLRKLNFLEVKSLMNAVMQVRIGNRMKRSQPTN